MKFKIRALIVALLCVLTLSLVSCDDSSKSTIKFYAFGDTGELQAYKTMVDKFNETVGKEQGIKVAYSPFPESSYEQKIVNVAYSKNGPDVFMVLEKKFKKWASEGYLEPLDSYIANDSSNFTSDIWTETINRYRYNVDNNTSNVTDMRSMFADFESMKTLDLRNFDTSKVTDMSAMFSYSESLKSIDLSSFNTSKVTTMETMFYKCTNLETIYVGANWSTSSVTESVKMFTGCEKLIGAVAYDSNQITATMANTTTGYLTFKTN